MERGKFWGVLNAGEVLRGGGRVKAERVRSEWRSAGVTDHSPSLSSRLLSILVECVLSLCACVGLRVFLPLQMLLHILTGELHKVLNR